MEDGLGGGIAVQYDNASSIRLPQNFHMKFVCKGYPILCSDRKILYLCVCLCGVSVSVRESARERGGDRYVYNLNCSPRPYDCKPIEEKKHR